MKKRFRNLSKGKIVIGLFVLCLVVFGGYFGYHKFVVHADSRANKQVVNTVDEYKAMCQSGNIDPSQSAGDADNPFLILEIVPYYGQAEMGYLISGCEPIDFTKVNPSMYGGSSDRTRSVATTVFADEYKRDVNDDGVVDETCWEDDEWKNEKSKQITVHGYYEKVTDGKPGDFVIDHYEKDTSGMFFVKDEDGNDQPGYRPVFRKAKDGETGQFIWTTLYSNASGFTISEKDFNNYARKENQCVLTADQKIEYNPGDREYTTRTDTDYYYINENGWMNKEVDGHTESVFAGHVVNMNDFIRTSLAPDDRSEAAILDMKIAVKTIEPAELAKHPEWIDYADLIYIHQGYSVGSYNDWWKNKNYNKYHQVKDELGESYYKDNSDIQSNPSSAMFSADNDWGWNVAKKLFFKVNQMKDYDGSGQYGFAPLLFSVTALDNLNGLSESVYGSKWKSVTHQHLDYATMEAEGIEYKTGATNCGLYKFMLMNFLMDQTNFEDYFFEKRQDGTTVITEDASKDVSYCSKQNSADAQEYWSVDAFLPVTEKENDTNISDEQIERYSISHYGNAYLNYPRPSLHGATFIYNSDTLLSQGFNNASIAKDDKTKAAFDWFEDQYGEKMDSMNPAQMVHYLLQYKRGGGDNPFINTKDKEAMHVLEIEPCADFTLSDEYLKKYLPANKFGGKIEVDHMTTAEFNASKRDLNGYYDLIYIGDNTGKFNTAEGTKKTKHNDSKLDNYIYIHVGDRAGDVRSSGDDISKLKREALKSYAQGGNALVLADSLASFPKDKNGNEVTSGDYVNTYLKIVDTTSRMHELLNALKSDNTSSFKKNNVCALSRLSIKFLSKYCLNYMGNGFSLPVKAKTSLTSKKYKEMTKKYKDLVGIISKITSTPPTYVSDVKLMDEEDKLGGEAANASLKGSTLDFKFMIGDQTENNKYAVRLYIDLNGDGIIADDELVQDTYAKGSGTTYTYAGEDTEYMDKNGKAIQIPRTQKYSYDISTNNRLYLIKNRRSGAVSWKFVLYNTKTKDNYQAVTGTSRYDNPKKPQGSKTAIKALQIVSDGKMSTSMNLENDLADTGSLFASYATNLTDFDITVKTISLTEFVNEVKAGVTASPVVSEDYNSFIVSCGSELYASADNKAAADFLTTKAKIGTAVIYTGDAVKDTTKSSDAKDLLGMSRYTDSLELYGEINDTATAPDTSEYSNVKNLEYTYAKVMQEGTGKYKVYNNDLWDKLEYGAKPSKATASGRNNKGRVTTYPYTIESSIKISGRGAQDYQLNMDNDSLAVWYSLEGDDNTQYGISPRDGANNYYLYSVENVVYDLIDLENVSDAMEMKLFINTLSGSAVSPMVVVDSGKSVDSNYKDFKIKEATSDYFSVDADGTKKSADGSDMTVYKGAIEPNGSTYQDYDASGKKVKGDGSGSGGKIDDTDPTPVPATPTPKPKKEPKILFNNASGMYYGNYSTSDDTTFAGWDDDSILVIDYKTEATWWDSSYKIAKVTDSSGKEILSLPNKTQTYKIKLGDLRSKYGLSANAKIPSFAVKTDCWQFILYTIGIFEDEDAYNKYINGGSSSDGDSDGTGETITEEDTKQVPEHTDITGQSYIPDSATHRISFTPYTNATACVNVNSFKISLITGSVDDLGTADEKVIDYVDTIYQKFTDAEGKHTWKYKASADHTFNLKDKNFLKDREQYYFLSDESFINNTTDKTLDKTRWVRFDISNRRKSAISYLHLFYEGDVDTTYVFPLD